MSNQIKSKILKKSFDSECPSESEEDDSVESVVEEIKEDDEE